MLNVDVTLIKNNNNNNNNNNNKKKREITLKQEQ